MIIDFFLERRYKFCPRAYVGSPQKFDYSHNYTIFDPVQLFPQDIWQVQIWPQHR